MASGLVALLDPVSDAAVRAIWSEFQQTFGVHGVSITPIPHFSLHVAEAYDREMLDLVLADMLATFPPFTVRTAGLGIFGGHLPVIHIVVVRDAGLSAQHARFWERITPLATGAQSYYHPDQWQPHITIAQGDITGEQLPGAIRMLTLRDFNWTITVDTLALLQDSGTGTSHQIASSYTLSGVNR